MSHAMTVESHPVVFATPPNTYDYIHQLSADMQIKAGGHTAEALGVCVASKVTAIARPPAHERPMRTYSSILLNRFPTNIIESGANRVMATKIPYCVPGVFSNEGLLTRIIETTMFATWSILLLQLNSGGTYHIGRQP